MQALERSAPVAAMLSALALPVSASTQDIQGDGDRTGLEFRTALERAETLTMHGKAHRDDPPHTGISSADFAPTVRDSHGELTSASKTFHAGAF